MFVRFIYVGLEFGGEFEQVIGVFLEGRLTLFIHRLLALVLHLLFHGILRLLAAKLRILSLQSRWSRQLRRVRTDDEREADERKGEKVTHKHLKNVEDSPDYKLGSFAGIVSSPQLFAAWSVIAGRAATKAPRCDKSSGLKTTI